MSSNDLDADAYAVERVLLAYLAARDSGAARVLFRYVARYPQYTGELLLLTFDLAAGVDWMTHTPIPVPVDVRDRLLVVARASLLPNKEGRE